MRLKVVIGIKPEKEGYFVGEKIILVAKLMTTSLFSRETHSFDIGSKKDSLQFNWQIGNESFENKGNIINYKIEENGEKARLITVEVKDKTSSKIKPIIGRVIIKIKNVKFGIDIYNYNEKKTLSKEFGSILPIEVGKNSTLILTPLIEGDDINNYLIGWEYKNQLNKTHGIESNQNALVLKAESRERIKCNFNKKDNTIKQYLDRIIEIKEKYKENIEIRIIKPKTKDELEIEEDVEFPVMAKIAGDINNKVKEVFWGIFKRTELEPLPIKGYLTITKPNEEINFKIQKFPSGEYSLLAAGIDKDGNIIGKSDKINIYIIEKNEKIEEEIKVDNEQTQKTLIEDKIKVKIISPSTKEDTQIPFPIEINKKIIVMAIINEDTKNKVKEIFWTVMPKDVQINELTIKEYNYLISSYPSQGENLDLKGINSGEYILIATAVDEKREPMKYFDTINIKIFEPAKLPEFKLKYKIPGTKDWSEFNEKEPLNIKSGDSIDFILILENDDINNYELNWKAEITNNDMFRPSLLDQKIPSLLYVSSQGIKKIICQIKEKNSNKIIEEKTQTIIVAPNELELRINKINSAKKTIEKAANNFKILIEAEKIKYIGRLPPWTVFIKYLKEEKITQESTELEKKDFDNITSKILKELTTEMVNKIKPNLGITIFNKYMEPIQDHIAIEKDKTINLEIGGIVYIMAEVSPESIKETYEIKANSNMQDDEFVFDEENNISEVTLKNEGKKFIIYSLKKKNKDKAEKSIKITINSKKPKINYKQIIEIENLTGEKIILSDNKENIIAKNLGEVLVLTPNTEPQEGLKEYKISSKISGFVEGKDKTEIINKKLSKLKIEIYTPKTKNIVYNFNSKSEKISIPVTIKVNPSIIMTDSQKNIIYGPTTNNFTIRKIIGKPIFIIPIFNEDFNFEVKQITKSYEDKFDINKENKISRFIPTKTGTKKILCTFKDKNKEINITINIEVTAS